MDIMADPEATSSNEQIENEAIKSAAVRGATVFLGLLIVYVLLSSEFRHPIVAGEDGALWLQSYLYGIKSLLIPLAGYLNVAARIIGWCSQLFPVKWAPTIFLYAGIAVDVLVIWLLTSPRLDLPYKPLLSLAIVSVAHAGVIIGVSMTHIQWVMPLAAFAMIFMRPSRLVWILIGEAVFVLASALTGPFSVVLAPLFAVQTFLIRKDFTAARRMAILTGAACIGMVGQLAAILSDPFRSFQPNFHPVFHWLKLSDWAGFINTCFELIFWPIGPWIFKGKLGVVLALVILCAVGVLVAVSIVRSKRYRAQMIFMILFSVGIISAGVAKIGPQDRYFYYFTIFVIWFSCCVISELRSAQWRVVAICALIIPMLGAVVHNRDSYMAQYDNADTKETILDWSHWSKFIHSGLPLTIPYLPHGWFINVPADPAGPKSQLTMWTGQDLRTNTSISDSCVGTVDSVTHLDENFYILKRADVNAYEGKLPRWVAKGRAKIESGYEDNIVVVADLKGRVLGFGYGGFGAPGSGLLSDWTATFSSSEPNIRAYLLSDDSHRACLLSSKLDPPK